MAFSLLLTWADQTNEYIDYLQTGSLQIKTNTDRRNGTMDLTLVGPASVIFGYTGGNGIGTAQTEVTIEFKDGASVLFDGIIRSVAPRDLRPGTVAATLACQDFTSVYSDYVIDPTSAVRTTIETDLARIAWLFSTYMVAYPQGVPDVFGTSVIAAMPTQDFTGMTVAEALNDVCKITGADWYPQVGTTGGTVIYNSEGVIRPLTTPFGVAATDTLTSTAHGLVVDDRLAFTKLIGGTGLSLATPYYVITAGLTANNFQVSTTSGGAAVNFTTDISVGNWNLLAGVAPFGLSDTPNGTTTYGYADLSLPEETTEYKSSVLIIGGGGYFGTFNRSAGYLTYNNDQIGQRTGVIKDTSIVDAADAQLAADAYFVERGQHRTQGSVSLWQPGITSGMDVAITSANQLWNQHGHQTGSAGASASSPQTYRVSTVTLTYPREGLLKYTLSLGNPPRLLEHAIFDIAGNARATAEDVVAGVLRGYIGEIVGWPLATPPTGFLLCDGASLLRAGTYSLLFAVISTTFGAADGTHFNVPDLRGRFPLGVDGSHALASTGGAINHTHTQPTHTHTGPSHTHTQPNHSHTGPSHTHTGPSHTHTADIASNHMPTDMVVIFNVSSERVLPALGTGGRMSVSEAFGAGDAMTTNSGGTGATGSGGTGATGSDGNDDTGSGGTGATGSGGGDATGTNNPPYLAIHYVIRYA